MILADSEIKNMIETGNIGFDMKPGTKLEDHLGPSSLDFRLGNEFKVYKRSKIACIDPQDPTSTKDMIETAIIPDGGFFMLHPRQFVLGVTAEKIRIPNNLVARCEGRSSLGRLGIIIHSTAGFIDPGFEGTITLEITNINEVPIKLYPGMRFGQYAFERLEGKVMNPYNLRKSSKYMHQMLPEESRVFEDAEMVGKKCKV